MAQEIQVTLDNKSIEILKKVDKIHRDTILNLGIAMIEKTGLYKTLTGEDEYKLEDIASLDNLSSSNSDTSNKKSEISINSTKVKSWDEF